MWQGLWPELPEQEIPIGHVTNGVHFTTWIGEEMGQLLDFYLGARWRKNQDRAEIWERVEDIPEGELWQAHEKQRERLIKEVRRRLASRLEGRGAPAQEVTQARSFLHPRVLTIGFARRFAAYKRPTLLLHDLERLIRLVNHPQMPVQIIYAGKAHPRDEEGKRLIQQIVAASQRPELKGRLISLEDYDMELAKLMVQGVDLWLANPRRPLEACSTSGMKAVLNGSLFMSTLDGWWDEAWNPEAGWAIGRGGGAPRSPLPRRGRGRTPVRSPGERSGSPVL